MIKQLAQGAFLKRVKKWVVSSSHLFPLRLLMGTKKEDRYHDCAALNSK